MFSGERLDSVALKMQTHKTGIEKLKARLGLLFLKMPYQVVLNLRGGNSDPVKFEGEEIDVETARELETCESVSHIYLYYMYQVVLAVIFGKMELAADLAINQCEPREAAAAGTVYTALCTFYACVAFIDHGEKMTPKMRLCLEKYMAMLKDYSIGAKSTYLHKYIFLEAELHKDTEYPLTTLDKFEEAIALANESRFVQDAAFINERCALWLSKSSKKRATTYLKEAYRLWSWWGATAKTQSMRTTYREELDLKGLFPSFLLHYYQESGKTNRSA